MASILIHFRRIFYFSFYNIKYYTRKYHKINSNNSSHNKLNKYLFNWRIISCYNKS